jgi:hypothetical protein
VVTTERVAYDQQAIFTNYPTLVPAQVVSELKILPFHVILGSDLNSKSSELPDSVKVASYQLLQVSYILGELLL